jgi:hypothetical protein
MDIIKFRLNKEYVVGGGKKGKIGIYDLRNLKKIN